MSPIHAVGDIHGHIDKLYRAIDLIDSHGDPSAPVVFLGDYVDRGPHSREVIDVLMQGQAEGRNWICLIGNHDRFILKFLEDPFYDDPGLSRPLLWTDPPLGGRTTLASYGVDTREDRSLEDIQADARDAIPQEHLDWIDSRPRYYETEDQIFAHAGLRPGVPLPEQAETDLLWIRKGFLDTPHDWGRLLVHGHTALERPELYDYRLNMDGGAAYGRLLVPALIEGRTVSLLDETGRTVLSRMAEPAY